MRVGGLIMLEEKISLYEILAEAEEEIKQGKVKDSDEVYNELLKEIERY